MSEEALKSYLIRENFLDRAIAPVANAFFDNCRFLEQEKAIESGGSDTESRPESENQSEDEPRFGGAKVGDLIQWEVDGMLQMEKPMRVRLVTDDGWVAVEGSETGIPMEQVLVEERGTGEAPPTLRDAPRFKLEEPQREGKPAVGETEWMRNLVGRDTKVRLMVSGGEMGAKEIGKLIKLLKAQQSVLLDDDEDDDDGEG